MSFRNEPQRQVYSEVAEVETKRNFTRRLQQTLAKEDSYLRFHAVEVIAEAVNYIS